MISISSSLCLPMITWTHSSLIDPHFSKEVFLGSIMTCCCQGWIT